MKIKILFLYTELAEYFLACVRALVQEHPVEVHIVRWPINKEAPFQFDIPEFVQIYDKQEYDRQQLISLSQKIEPSLIFCSGWMDKDYLAVVRSFHKKVPTVVGMDNHWQANVKQQIARLLAPFTLQRLFTHAFVAGAPQYDYARKLSFSKEKILQGYYSANVPFFQSYFLQNKEQKETDFPKRFLYVGRYIEHKGIKDLWEAFTQLQNEHPSDWELWCLGTGALEAEARQHPKIKHYGFVQPSQMESFISQTGVFVLPSHFEPWGVVVHEFAAAGYPLLCSREVGAATVFLEESKNGFSFEAGNIQDLKEKLLKIVKLPAEELLKMSEESVKLAKQNTPQIWSEKLMRLIENK